MARAHQLSSRTVRECVDATIDRICYANKNEREELVKGRS